MTRRVALAELVPTGTFTLRSTWAQEAKPPAWTKAVLRLQGEFKAAE